jgi:hypothetical protein
LFSPLLPYELIAQDATRSLWIYHVLVPPSFEPVPVVFTHGAGKIKAKKNDESPASGAHWGFVDVPLSGKRRQQKSEAISTASLVLFTYLKTF